MRGLVRRLRTRSSSTAQRPVDELAETLDLGRDRAGARARHPARPLRGRYPDEVAATRRGDASASRTMPASSSFVGWVRPYKGVAELLEAFAAVDDPTRASSSPGARRRRRTRARVAALAAADERVRLDLGFVPDDELQVYLRAADVVATPFLEIFTSGSVLLAMSFGRADHRAAARLRRGDGRRAAEPCCTTPTIRGLRAALRAAMSADLEAMGRHNASRLLEVRLAPRGRRHARRLRGGRLRAVRR